MYRNNFLEKLTKAHRLIIGGVYLPLIVYMLYYSYSGPGFASSIIILIFLGGVFAWTFFEYLVHRFLFHWETKKK